MTDDQDVITQRWCDERHEKINQRFDERILALLDRIIDIEKNVTRVHTWLVVSLTTLVLNLIGIIATIIMGICLTSLPSLSFIFLSF